MTSHHHELAFGRWIHNRCTRGALGQSRHHLLCLERIGFALLLHTWGSASKNADNVRDIGSFLAAHPISIQGSRMQQQKRALPFCDLHHHRLIVKPDMTRLWVVAGQVPHVQKENPCIICKGECAPALVVGYTSPLSKSSSEAKHQPHRNVSCRIHSNVCRSLSRQ